MDQRKPTPTVAIALGRLAVDSRVFINGQDISHAVRGIEVTAVVGELSTVTLTLSAAVEITGEAGVLGFNNPGFINPAAGQVDDEGDYA